MSLFIRELLHIGARHDGCTLVGEKEFCSVPSERWGHTSAIFHDDTMVVYGGYSHRCLDYCDDVWAFDLRDNTWHEIYPRGHFLQGLYIFYSTYMSEIFCSVLVIYVICALCCFNLWLFNGLLRRVAV